MGCTNGTAADGTSATVMDFSKNGALEWACNALSSMASSQSQLHAEKLRKEIRNTEAVSAIQAMISGHRGGAAIESGRRCLDLLSMKPHAAHQHGKVNRSPGHSATA